MLCATCHTEMSVVNKVYDNGKGETVTQLRCVTCWKHETVIEKREATG